eukprot:6181792-Pleurochrysis_carterae.AAC.1
MLSDSLVFDTPAAAATPSARRLSTAESSGSERGTTARAAATSPDRSTAGASNRGGHTPKRFARQVSAHGGGGGGSGGGGDGGGNSGNIRASSAVGLVCTEGESSGACADSASGVGGSRGGVGGSAWASIGGSSGHGGSCSIGLRGGSGGSVKGGNRGQIGGESFRKSCGGSGSHAGEDILEDTSHILEGEERACGGGDLADFSRDSLFGNLRVSAIDACSEAVRACRGCTRLAMGAAGLRFFA